MDRYGRPVIGINLDVQLNSAGATILGANAGYLDCISEAGGNPIMIPSMNSQENIEAALDLLDGFVMIGGADLDCTKDGWELHKSMRCAQPRRDTFDRKLMDAFERRHIPLLAIGSGMQLLNVHMGGTLMLHIPEDRPKAMPHRDPTDPEHSHEILVEENSALSAAYLDWRTFSHGQVFVNSQHHQAVDDLGRGMRVTGRACDGIIESIESTNPDWFAWGVQFHPELMHTKLDITVFETFLKSCGKLRIAA